MSRHHHNPNWPRIVRAVRRRDRDRPCLFCDLPVVLGHVHHVVHVEDGGTDDLDNLRLVCATCTLGTTRRSASQRSRRSSRPGTRTSEILSTPPNDAPGQLNPSAAGGMP